MTAALVKQSIALTHPRVEQRAPGGAASARLAACPWGGGDKTGNRGDAVLSDIPRNSPGGEGGIFYLTTQETALWRLHDYEAFFWIWDRLEGREKESSGQLREGGLQQGE